MVIVAATLCDRLVKAATPPAAVAANVPCNAPLPAPRAAFTTVVLSLLRKLPYWSSTRTTGCCANATPAVAVADGCGCMVKRLAAAGLITMLPEGTGVTPPPVKLIVIVVATGCERLVYVASPLSNG